MNRGKKINKDYVHAEEGIVDAIEFHNKYHKPLTFVTFINCEAYPCRLIRNDKEFLGIVNA